ncbi:alpha-amylase family protein [Cedecea colo]|uniref:Glycosidase n=1 Tax=Cedecea colo TaxID=2552946 RepID=A0ABX0VI74_9ENTR|nr:alpha-amylase family protein [Cedecea colo]NIY46684.1 glycosidase [Cedecea colo]
MKSDWYKNAIIYQIDTALFFDANGDGWGDLQGITQRLDYIRGIGATCVWLTPFYLTPFRDGGYDISDHLRVDSRFGDVADMVMLVERAEELGLHVIIELVLQHTSSEHLWFQQAKRDRKSPYRDYYIWADTPPEKDDAPMFPGVEKSVWSWDEEAQQYYRHMFYHHEPDLNLSCPQVIKEIERVIVFWLRMGISGFRFDAASHMVKQAGKGSEEKGYDLLTHLRDFISRRRPEILLLGEVDVPAEQYRHYFGDNNRLSMLLSFNLNKKFYVSLARKNATALLQALEELPAPPFRACFANWLRNHDELDLDGLSQAEKRDVMKSFGPDKNMHVYQRGLRRRLAPMLKGNIKRLAMAHAVLFSLPGTPVLRYGDEIGMGDDLQLEERNAVRTPMQWSDLACAGFSEAEPEKLIVPVIDTGPYRYQKVNVNASLINDNSLLHRVSKIARARLGLNEIGSGDYHVIDTRNPAIFALRYNYVNTGLLLLANFCSQKVTAEITEADIAGLTECLADKEYKPSGTLMAPLSITLNGYGYRWFSIIKARG